MRRHPEIFELLVDRREYDARTVLRWRSRRFGVDHSIAIRDDWGADPRRLADFIERLVGDPLHEWADMRVDGRSMAQALQPYWEREIHRYMERVEYEGRHRDYRVDPRIDAMRYMAFDEWGSWAPQEDPKAKEKARQLLLRNLDAGQEKSFKKDKEFRVTAKDGKVYRITHARSFNVIGPDGAKYCGQTVDTPIEDQMLAQKLLLEHDPDKFFKNANVSPASGGVGFLQSGTGALTTWDEVLRPGGLVYWDRSA